MTDNTSQTGASSTLLENEASGIHAPVRLIQPIPRTRYGWRAAIIVLAHVAVLGAFLLRLDFLSGSSIPSKPESLDIIVVDLSGDNGTTPPPEPVADHTFTNPPQTASAAPPAESKPFQEVSTIAFESTTQPIVKTLAANKEAPTTEPTESSERSEVPAPKSAPIPKAEPIPPPEPAAKPAAATASRNNTATSSSTTNNTPQQSTIGLNRESESQTTPPRLDPAYLHNPAPNYPALSKRNRESGTVLLLVKVDPEGNATTVTLHQSSGYDRLDQAAIHAVTRWRFVPGMRGQTAISATVIVPISFKQP